MALPTPSIVTTLMLKLVPQGKESSSAISINHLKVPLVLREKLPPQPAALLKEERDLHIKSAPTKVIDPTDLTIPSPTTTTTSSNNSRRV